MDAEKILSETKKVYKTQELLKVIKRQVDKIGHMPKEEYYKLDEAFNNILNGYEALLAETFKKKGMEC
jgi:hypothetical protein